MSVRPAATACLAALLLAGPLLAEEAPQPSADQKAAIAELMEVMNMRLLLKQMSSTMAQSMRQAMDQQTGPMIEKIPAEKRARFSALVSELMDSMTKSPTVVFQDPEVMTLLEGEMSRAYLKTFTVEEIRAITAFYRSPVGHKALVELPRIMSDMMPGMMTILQPRIQAAVAKDIARFTEQAKKLGAEQ